jgi:hypothetical protein
LCTFYAETRKFFTEGFVTHARTVKVFGTFAAALLVIGGSAVARDGARPRGANLPRTSAPHSRSVERQRTENGHTRTDTRTGPNGRTATRDAVVTNDREAGTRTRNVDYTGPNGKTRSVDSVTTRTDDGLERSTTVTNADGKSATRDLDVSRNKETGTVTREASYTTFDGKEGSMSDVIQRTDDGYTRDTTRTLPNGETHTRNVEVSCNPDAGKCVKEVEVDRQN